MPALLVSLLLLAGCGSGSTGSEAGAGPSEQRSTTPSSDTSTPRPTAAEPAGTPYFKAGDTKAINVAAAAAGSAGRKAHTVARMKVCNKITAYPAWRRCWHSLLDPYERGLSRVAGVLTSMQDGAFPARCQAELGRSGARFKVFADRVDGLLAGIDSDRRADQVRTAKRYGSTLDGIGRGFAKPFQDLTQVCYSPEDLASINATPTPSR